MRDANTPASSPHPSARCARLHFGQMPPLPRTRFCAHAIATRHTQIPKAVHQQVVLLHYLATFVGAIQPVLPEEILQRPEPPSVGLIACAANRHIPRSVPSPWPHPDPAPGSDRFAVG